MPNQRSSFGSKTRLDKNNLERLASPARNSSLTRMVSGIASGIGGLLKRSSSKGPASVTSAGKKNSQD